MVPGAGICMEFGVPVGMDAVPVWKLELLAGLRVGLGSIGAGRIWRRRRSWKSAPSEPDQLIECATGVQAAGAAGAGGAGPGASDCAGACGTCAHGRTGARV